MNSRGQPSTSTEIRTALSYRLLEGDQRGAGLSFARLGARLVESELARSLGCSAATLYATRQGRLDCVSLRLCLWRVKNNFNPGTKRVETCGFPFVSLCPKDFLDRELFLELVGRL